MLSSLSRERADRKIGRPKVVVAALVGCAPGVVAFGLVSASHSPGRGTYGTCSTRKQFIVLGLLTLSPFASYVFGVLNRSQSVLIVIRRCHSASYLQF